MNHGIADADVKVEFVERRAAIIVEILLDLDLDIVAREVASQLISVTTEFVRNGRKENLDRHNYSLKLRLSFLSLARRSRLWEGDSRIIPFAG